MRIGENMHNGNQFPIQVNKASGHTVVKHICPSNLISVIEVATKNGFRLTMFRKERTDVCIPDFRCMHCNTVLWGGFDICSSCLQPVTARGKGVMEEFHRFERKRSQGKSAVSDKGIVHSA